MAVEPAQRESQAPVALDALAAATRRFDERGSVNEALGVVVEAARTAAGADVVVGRVLESGRLVARAVAATSSALAAEIEGSSFALAELGTGEVSELETLPAVVRRLAERAHAEAVLQVPVDLCGRVLGSLEFLR